MNLIVILFVSIFPVVFANTALALLRALINPTDRSFNCTKSKENKFVVEDFVELVKKHNYPAEEHEIFTQDGYILKVHRMPASPKSPSYIGKPIVLLQHGIFSSSDGWVLMEPEKTLAFILADEGYDVWIGNARGNTYSRAHRTLSPDDETFWEFSWHEIAVYDLPAIIDYALNVTGEATINYIGHSMGTTVSYVLLSMKPEYNEKIKFAISLAPVALWKVPPQTTYPINKSTMDLAKMILEYRKMFEIFPQSTGTAKMVHDICYSGTTMQVLCSTLFNTLVAEGNSLFNVSHVPFVMSHVPAGGSAQTLLHFGQNIMKGKFQQYDHGTKNVKMYGRRKPPVYDLKKITVPFAFIYTENDALVRSENVEELAKSLLNVIAVIKIPDQQFNHVDYFWAKGAKDNFHNKIINFLRKQK